MKKHEDTLPLNPPGYPGLQVLLRGHRDRQTHQPAHRYADEARQIIKAKNQAQRQPVLNLQIAKAYLAGTDKGIATRTCQNAFDALINTKLGSNQNRWKTAAKDKAFIPLLSRVIIETPGELRLQVIRSGKVSECLRANLLDSNVSTSNRNMPGFS